jgi:hypothetical protein
LSRRTLIIFVWLVIGAIAGSQRGYYVSRSPLGFGCTGSATIAVTILAGPLNYIGVRPSIACNWPSPS